MPDLVACVLDLERTIGASRVASDPDHCAPYAHDDSPVQGLVPAAVVHASSADDIANALRICTRHGVPVYPRAAGSGRTGGAVPMRPGVVLDTLAMSAIEEIDRRDLVAVVQPGVVLARLHEAVEADGLFYPPDPNSLDWCALGGNIAENAGGPRAFKYGVTREYVLGLEATLMDGTRLRTGKRTVKGVTGYDVTALLVGSEGTLAVFSRATLRLIPKPEAVRTLVALFATSRAAGEAVMAIVAAGLVPRCLELLDRECCDAIRDAGSMPLAPDVGALLLIELDGDEVSVDPQMERVGDVCEASGARDVQVAKHGGDRARLWESRRAMSVALRARAKHKLSEDIVVPRSKVGAMIEAVEAIGRDEGLRLPAYGHAGDGNLHVNFLWDEAHQRSAVDRAITAVFRATVAFGGTLTGEHGLGVLKRDHLPLEQSDDLIDLQRRIKATFDPHGLLNPDKMFPTAGHRAC